MTEVNVPLLRKVVEWAEAEASKPLPIREWEQGAWMILPEAFDEPMEDDQGELFFKDPECGTCFCIAGKTVELSLEEGENMDSSCVESPDGFTESIPMRAARELGIPRDAGPFIISRLFHAENSIADVRRIAEDIAGERL